MKMSKSNCMPPITAPHKGAFSLVTFLVFIIHKKGYCLLNNWGNRDKIGRTSAKRKLPDRQHGGK